MWELVENLKYKFRSYERKEDRIGAERKNQEELEKGKKDKVSWEGMVGGSLIESPMAEQHRESVVLQLSLMVTL